MLEIDKIKEIIKEGKHADLSAAIEFQSWLQGHFNSDKSGQSYVKRRVLDLSRELLPDENTKSLEKLLVSPLPSTEILSECYEKLQVVLNGRNATSNFTGNSSAVESTKKWIEENKVESSFKSRSWELFKTAPNSLVIIDSPSKDSDIKEPYITFCDISKLFAFKVDKSTELFRWAVIQESEDLFLIYTTEVFARMQKVKDSDGNNIGFDYSEVKHGIGLCPVNFLWQTAANANQKEIKQTPVFSQLAELDRYNLSVIGHFKQKTTSINPILVAIEQECGYKINVPLSEDEIVLGVTYNTYECESGLVNGNPCPQCSGKALAGAGVVLTKPVPMVGESEITKAAEYIAPPIQDVIFIKQDLQDIKSNILLAMTGKASSIERKQAINKDQVFANKSDHETIIRNLSKNFSFIKTWAINALIRLKNQNDRVVYSSNYGTEFLTRTELELIELIGLSRESGMPNWYIKSLELELAELKNVGNKSEQDRQKVMDAIEPLPNISLEDAKFISLEQFVKKAMFPDFIREYESNMGSIGNYEGDFRLHITSLKNQFIKFLENVNIGREENATKTDQDESGTNPRG